jgi:uncharacterized protein (DUF58 family)
MMVNSVYQRGTPTLFVTSLVLVFVALILFSALLNGATNLIILCLLVFVMMGGIRIWASLATRKADYSFSVDRTRLFAGEDLEVTVQTGNKGILPISIDLYFPLNSFSDQHRDSFREEYGLLWFQKSATSWKFTAPRRGVHTIGPLSLAVGDLLGFSVRDISQREAAQIVVYPKLVRLRPFSVPRRDFFGVPGGKSPVDDPVYILGTIDYHHGRPARYIHWKASARHHRLQQKVFEPTEQEKVLLLVDAGDFDRNEEAFERILEVVASFAARFDRKGCALGFATNAEVDGISPVAPVTRSPSQPQAILDILARMTPRIATPMTEVIRCLNVPWGTSCIYFCFESGNGVLGARSHLISRRLPVVLVTYEDARRLRESPPDRNTRFSWTDESVVGVATL